MDSLLNTLITVFPHAHHEASAFTDILLDTVMDTLKIIPFLLLTYLFIEWIESQTDKKFEAQLQKQDKLSVLYGSVLGLFPSCGFSNAASSLYATGVISAGVLAAVFLSTSDEMLAIMISKGASFSLYAPILLVKLIVSLIAGYLLHFAVQKKDIAIEEFCEREHDDHQHGILYSAGLHTIQVVLWLFVITFILNYIIESIGLDTIQAIVANNPRFSIFLAALVGMIPSCGSSIVLSTMFYESVITFPTVCAGLLANAGTGIIVLFRVNPNWKDNLKILLYILVVAIISGFVLQLFF